MSRLDLKIRTGQGRSYSKIEEEEASSKLLA